MHQWHIRVDNYGFTLNITIKMFKIWDNIETRFWKMSEIILYNFSLVVSNVWLENYLKRILTSSKKRYKEHWSFISCKCSTFEWNLCNIDWYIIQIHYPHWQIDFATSSISYCKINSDVHGVKWNKKCIIMILEISTSVRKFLDNDCKECSFTCFKNIIDTPAKI